MQDVMDHFVHHRIGRQHLAKKRMGKERKTIRADMHVRRPVGMHFVYRRRREKEGRHGRGKTAAG